jgi:ArsR family metal-binding transcriptional regulator
MARARHLEIYRHLKKTNCGYCQERTCMAFALAVARGDRPIGECPYVDPSTAGAIMPD